MTKIPTKLLHELLEDPDFPLCTLLDYPGHICHGRPTFHHAIIHSGKQLQKKWAIVRACAKAHGVDYFQDNGDCTPEVLRWVALNQATGDELDAISDGLSYRQELKHLNAKYGVWEQKYPEYWSKLVYIK